jgi:hypothetical protein
MVGIQGKLPEDWETTRTAAENVKAVLLGQRPWDLYLPAGVAVPDQLCAGFQISRH